MIPACEDFETIRRRLAELEAERVAILTQPPPPEPEANHSQTSAGALSPK